MTKTYINIDHIALGALSPLLIEQIPDLGDFAEMHQTNADAITRLYLQGLLTEKETDKARRRLVKKIVQLVNAKRKRDAA